MIKGLYETHLEVSDLAASIDFYQDILGLELASVEENRRIAFFWIGQPKEFMLGLWEKAGDQLAKRHFAFRCEVDDVVGRAVDWLTHKGLQPYNFLKTNDLQPMVFAWMPAIAIYFNDPDGNVLEFIAILPGEGKPGLGVISYSEWLESNKE
jgi:lactoylglutathione lyase